MKKTHHKGIMFCIIAFIFIIILLEIYLRVLFYIIENNNWNKNQRYKSSIYKNSSWAKNYFDCLNRLDRLEEDYRPFYEWRKNGFNSKFINISDDGIRKTWNPSYTNNLRKVFVFGGSNIWGVGSRDDYTIPSSLSKNLNCSEEHFYVVNFGESAYMSTQEAIMLITELRKGNVPDCVIFYDGFNDVLAAFENGKAGLINHYPYLRMKLTMKPKIFNEMTKEAFIDDSKLLFAIDSIINKYIKKEKYRFEYSDHELNTLAKEIIEEYKKNIFLVEKLSKAYDFKYIFLWQPALFTIQSKTDEEIACLKGKNRNLEKLYFYTYKLADNLHIPNFYNLSHIFDNKNETAFIDWCHIGEKQNQIVADEIFNLIKNELKK